MSELGRVLVEMVGKYHFQDRKCDVDFFDI